MECEKSEWITMKIHAEKMEENWINSMYSHNKLIASHSRSWFMRHSSFVFYFQYHFIGTRPMFLEQHTNDAKIDHIEPPVVRRGNASTSGHIEIKSYIISPWHPRRFHHIWSSNVEHCFHLLSTTNQNVNNEFSTKNRKIKNENQIDK